MANNNVIASTLSTNEISAESMMIEGMDIKKYIQLWSTGSKVSISDICTTGTFLLFKIKIEGEEYEIKSPVYDDTELKNLISQKVDKVDGKGLSSNDFTNEEKTKLASLINYDDTEIRTQISNKVDKETGKGLSSNDFTNEEKTKLSSLENYDDTQIKSDISKKVDKETGKGLSSNDYTTLEKTKLESLHNYDDTLVKTLISGCQTDIADITDTLSKKVDKEAGKGLSSNDYTTTEKTKLESLHNYDDTEVRTLIDKKVSKDIVGTANGVASLDSNGKVPSEQLPSYVDDVIEGYYHENNFYKDPEYSQLIVGEKHKIYVDIPTNKTYRFNNGNYILISNPITVDSEFSETSENPLQNKVLTNKIKELENDINTLYALIEELLKDVTIITPTAKSLNKTITDKLNLKR